MEKFVASAAEPGSYPIPRPILVGNEVKYIQRHGRDGGTWPQTNSKRIPEVLGIARATIGGGNAGNTVDRNGDPMKGNVSSFTSQLYRVFHVLYKEQSTNSLAMAKHGRLAA